MIKLQNVNEKFPDGTEALTKIKLNIAKGEFIFLVGPSGAGKSTLLKLLIAEFKPSSGQIFVEGEEINKFSGKKIAFLRRKVRMIFQDFKILFDRTVLENVILALNILGRKEKEAVAETKKVLKLVGLEEKYNFFPVQISAGEQQRVAVARALAGGPSVILADEPTGNLDPKTSESIIKLLEEINKAGTTVIVATHNASLVDKFKKRVVALERGKIVRDDKEGKYN